MYFWSCVVAVVISSICWPKYTGPTLYWNSINIEKNPGVVTGDILYNTFKSSYLLFGLPILTVRATDQEVDRYIEKYHKNFINHPWFAKYVIGEILHFDGAVMQDSTLTMKDTKIFERYLYTLDRLRLDEEDIVRLCLWYTNFVNNTVFVKKVNNILKHRSTKELSSILGMIIDHLHSYSIFLGIDVYDVFIKKMLSMDTFGEMFIGCSVTLPVGGFWRSRTISIIKKIHGVGITDTPQALYQSIAAGWECNELYVNEQMFMYVSGFEVGKFNIAEYANIILQTQATGELYAQQKRQDSIKKCNKKIVGHYP